MPSGPHSQSTTSKTKPGPTSPDATSSSTRTEKPSLVWNRPSRWTARTGACGKTTSSSTLASSTSSRPSQESGSSSATTRPNASTSTWSSNSATSSSNVSSPSRLKLESLTWPRSSSTASSISIPTSSQKTIRSTNSSAEYFRFSRSPSNYKKNTNSKKCAQYSTSPTGR